MTLRMLASGRVMGCRQVKNADVWAKHLCEQRRDSRLRGQAAGGPYLMGDGGVLDAWAPRNKSGRTLTSPIAHRRVTQMLNKCYLWACLFNNYTAFHLP